MYTPNCRAPEVNQQLVDLKGEIEKSAIIVKNPIYNLDITFHNIKQLDLTDISRILQPTKSKYTFFSSAYEHLPGWTTFQAIKQTKKLKN